MGTKVGQHAPYANPYPRSPAWGCLISGKSTLESGSSMKAEKGVTMPSLRPAIHPTTSHQERGCPWRIRFFCVFGAALLLMGCHLFDSPKSTSLPPPTLSLVIPSHTQTVGTTQQLSATASNGGGITWSIDSGGGSLSTTGLFTAPATPGTTVVRAALTGMATSYATDSISVVAAPLTQTLLISSPSAGKGGIGQWNLYNPTTLAKSSTLAEAKGIPEPSSAALSDENGETGYRGGFTYNAVDHKFYAALDRASMPALTGQGLSPEDSPGIVVSFDPETDQLECLATIPLLTTYGTNSPLIDFLTSPLLSPDGKSLILVAQGGGESMPGPDGSAVSGGGVVHVDIDPASPTFKRFTPVYNFADHGRALPFNQQMVKVDGKPRLVRAGGLDMIFLVTGEVHYNVQGQSSSNPAKQMLLKPHTAANWAGPWEIASVAFSAPGREQLLQPWWDEFSDSYWYGANDNQTDSAFWQIKSKVGFGGPENHYFPPSTTLGMRRPVSIFTVIGHNGAYVINAGVDAANTDLNSMKIIELSTNPTTDPIERKRLSAYETGTTQRLWPAGVGVSPTTGLVFLNGTSQPGAQQIPAAIERTLANLPASTTMPSTAPYHSLPLDTLYRGGAGVSYLDMDGPLPGSLDAIDMANFALYNLVRGSAALGWVFVGAPALGGRATEPIADRYIVTLALYGGANGSGAVVKYDRLTGKVTSVPLGASTTGQPVGQPLQLASGLVLGGTNTRTAAGLTPTRSYQGVYTLDLATGATRDYPLPSADLVAQGKPQYTTALRAPLSFTRAANGTVWSLVPYYLHLLFSPSVVLAPGLFALDAATGAPTGEFHFFDASPGSTGPAAGAQGYLTPMAAQGNVLVFVTPTTFADAVDGSRIWCVDLATRDANNRPASGSALLAPGGAAADAWWPLFGPTLSKKTSQLYLMTTATGPTTSPTRQVRILKMQVGSPVTAAPTFTPVLSVAGGVDLPGTPLFEASDGNLYYGTVSGRLMKFDPVGQTITVAGDLATTPGINTDCRGFLSEASGGVLMGIVADQDSTGAQTARRAFRYTLASGVMTSAVVDASDRDPHPGVTPILH